MTWPSPPNGGRRAIPSGPHCTAPTWPALRSQTWDVSASSYQEPGWLTEAKWESTCSQVRDIDRDVFTGASAGAEAGYFERELTPYDLDPGFQILGDLARDLQAAGVTPVLLALPAPPDYLDAHTAGGVSYDDFRARLEDLAGTEQILLIDATDLFGDELSGFRDIRHLNVDGAVALSRALGPVLDDLTPRVVCLGCGP